MKKIIVTVLVAAFVGAGIWGWWYMANRFHHLFEDEIERAASEALGTPVTVGNVDLDLLSGAVRIEELAIGNPPGFAREHAVVFGAIEAAMDVKNMEVSRVVLDGVRIYIEEVGGVTNVQQLKKSLESRISGEVSIESDPEEEIVIRRFLMRSTIATFESASLQRLTEVEIDEIEMRDLEGTPDQVAEMIASEVIDEIAEEAARAMLQAQAEKQIEEVGDKVSEKLRELLGKDDDG